MAKKKPTPRTRATLREIRALTDEIAGLKHRANAQDSVISNAHDASRADGILVRTLSGELSKARGLLVQCLEKTLSHPVRRDVLHAEIRDFLGLSPERPSGLAADPGSRAESFLAGSCTSPRIPSTSASAPMPPALAREIEKMRANSAARNFEAAK
jgi:hypothetical protein